LRARLRRRSARRRSRCQLGTQVLEAGRNGSLLRFDVCKPSFRLCDFSKQGVAVVGSHGRIHCDYAGPKGSERFVYTLEEPDPFAAKATEILGRTLASDAFAISADVGSDLLSSWRRPSHAIIYLRQSVALDDLGLVDAHGRDDANVLLRMPDDTSLFTTIMHRAFDSTKIPLVDVPQMMWDLLDLGGEDREEAAGRLREWFIQHRKTS
jgi:hypothetical protein